MTSSCRTPSAQKRGELGKRFVRVVALNHKLDLRAGAGAKAHDAHDALAVGLTATEANLHCRLESIRQFDELGRRTGVQALRFTDGNNPVSA